MPGVNLTGVQVFYFILLLLSVPFQYMLVEWTGNASKLSQAEFASSIENVKNVMVSYFSLNSWRQWMKFQLKSILFPLQRKTKKDFKQMESNNECVANEVFKYRSPDGYFGNSFQIRSDRTFVKFRVGQVIRHKKYGYRGVIVGWDKTCRAPQHWIDANHHGHPEYRDHPSYSVLVDSRDRAEVQTTYVTQENIEVISNTLIKHPQIEDYFDFNDGAQYHMRSSLKLLYPYD